MPINSRSKSTAGASRKWQSILETAISCRSRDNAVRSMERNTPPRLRCTRCTSPPLTDWQLLCLLRVLDLPFPHSTSPRASSRRQSRYPLRRPAHRTHDPSRCVSCCRQFCCVRHKVDSMSTRDDFGPDGLGRDDFGRDDFGRGELVPNRDSGCDTPETKQLPLSFYGLPTATTSTGQVPRLNTIDSYHSALE
ncbi:uncharacterized protein BDR25DRAFT_117382 [Lindgomyces ingoldianus]|uniref:Uncharacterized protein n=1 Tax=Lindgomyces ingoldianus TaxID=673940 RepID=A0ACB6Q9B6_9PLEO|nr:uncharacterized protein BDR25DRAFT_117382 [Lindgomyces ingoldianus]KAF2462957.1 hypothetical protein BDR25DRAFT_117382 [Lindgomyces ingoldianus]